MPSKVKEIEKEALRLDPQERAILAEHLINSLDVDDDPDAERLWIEEAERRYKEYKEGRIATKSAEMVFREARAKYK